MNLTCILFGSLFLAAGLWFALCCGFRYTAAWKAMPPAERDRIALRPLCRNIGGMIALSGVIFLLKGIWEVPWFIWAMIAWLVLAGLDVWYISKSRRYTNL